ncbi:hypothetical protein L6452_14407 [Arctium lappa]|uniref:Uncharacterized protein n=1 Tax=Arctium lappa TaxID=4217 RepID=A0ACB9CL03_ARCLA|nr:hypothetical protein L6452_14407 [Arctium lappa]
MGLLFSSCRHLKPNPSASEVSQSIDRSIDLTSQIDQSLKTQKSITAYVPAWLLLRLPICRCLRPSVRPSSAHSPNHLNTLSEVLSTFAPLKSRLRTRTPSSCRGRRLLVPVAVSCFPLSFSLILFQEIKSELTFKNIV